METTTLTNHFIIAMPSLQDANFDRTVTYICEHDENGTFGLIINRDTDISLKEVFSQMEIEPRKIETQETETPETEAQAIENMANQLPNPTIFLGGPVQQNRGFILHSPPGAWSSTLKINEHIALTTSRDILEAIANNEGPKQAIIALGYAGWGPGQLEQEMVANTWLSCPADEQIIFNTPSNKRWQAAADLLGIDLQLLSSDSGHA